MQMKPESALGFKIRIFILWHYVRIRIRPPISGVVSTVPIRFVSISCILGNSRENCQLSFSRRGGGRRAAAAHRRHPRGFSASEQRAAAVAVTFRPVKGDQRQGGAVVQPARLLIEYGYFGEREKNYELPQRKPADDRSAFDV